MPFERSGDHRNISHISMDEMQIVFLANLLTFRLFVYFVLVIAFDENILYILFCHAIFILVNFTLTKIASDF